MTPERWAQIENLFHREAECQREHRGTILDEACSQDPELRREVEALLSGDMKVADGCMPNLIFSELSALVFPLSGHTVSHYRILGGLAGGGMGFLYRAEDIRLGRHVALKFLPEESIGNPLALKRFEREARAASALEHPNICPVYEFGEHEQRPFIVMPLLEGQTLADLICATHRKGERLEPGRIFDLALQIAQGLEAAHRQGIVHRDIKPANIFITTQGQAKILDFGLAKLADPVESEDEPDEDKNAYRVPGKPALSRTGATVGTVGYMSPEQARGERLDARTDLFSFGLVLYEMATGQRVFGTATEAACCEAVLPKRASELNFVLPAAFDAIIQKALRSDRKARYQTASQIRLDLEKLVQAKHPHHWKIGASILSIIAVFVGAIWFNTVRPVTPKSPVELRFRQLTTNPLENRVLGGAISPDGKYLAYGDLKGLHVKRMRTGEMRSIPQPTELIGTAVDWEVTAGWLPNATQFIVNAHKPGENADLWSSKGSSIWLASVLGGAPIKLRDDAMAYSVSPDGSQIAFGANKRGTAEREIWLMNTDGKHAVKFLEADGESSIGWLVWSPNGERVVYVVFDPAGSPTLVSRALSGGPLVTILPPQEMSELAELVWLRDGRLVYSLPEMGAIGDTCNYWIRKIDLRTGARIEAPRRLTNWSGFCPASGSASADGKYIAFAGWATRTTVYMADSEPTGSRIKNSRQFTSDESSNDPMDWTPDGTSLIFFSNRNGGQGVYKQRLDQDTPELLVSPGRRLSSSRVTPDGKWVLWSDESRVASNDGSARIMRIPIRGGRPESIVNRTRVSTLLCARPPSNLCAVAELSEKRREVIVTSIDPVKGLGPELVRFDADAANDWSCDMSPDGSRLAAIVGAEDPIRIIDLTDQKTTLIPTAQLHEKQTLSWAADGRGLFITHGVKGGSELVHMDLQGRFRSLWRNSGGHPPRALQSPDGRHLAIRSANESSNMWMMENF